MAAALNSPAIAPMTIEQNAELIEYLLDRITPDRPGYFVVSTLDDQQMRDLRATAERLRRMAPHEAEIRKVVAARLRGEQTRKNG